MAAKRKKKAPKAVAKTSGPGARPPEDRASWGVGAAALLVAALVVAWAVWEPTLAHSVVPERLRVEVERAYPHDTTSWTQGLVWHGGKLYEGTGLVGRSRLRRVDLATGRVEAETALPREVFGEGLALAGDELIQITWKDKRAFVWSLDGFKKRREHAYEGEGWGLCFDGKRLVMSDGSERLAFRDPKTFAETGAVNVTLAGQRFEGRLNELECVGEDVYANQWTNDEDTIVRIDAATGHVTARIDASGLLPGTERRGLDVLNGIAHVPERGTFLLTGKFWPKVFEVRFVPAK